jgi:hypothetical protein
MRREICKREWDCPETLTLGFVPVTVIFENNVDMSFLLFSIGSTLQQKSSAATMEDDVDFEMYLS